ncbi:hypothetical protein BJ508DRAFT_308227 [Ascobolus immersus RN42]|uniref:Uncharacterized protein n=1 Tax=Ascobolus immersus RN42 TaxID=1160509 RepID=A0A3N4I617_ASCIM|nr:hypothetical protein BJ508DRAFT_308227 [Ascobolus immersus RN42]
MPPIRTGETLSSRSTSEVNLPQLAQQETSQAAPAQPAQAAQMPQTPQLKPALQVTPEQLRLVDLQAEQRYLKEVAIDTAACKNDTASEVTPEAHNQWTEFSEKAKNSPVECYNPEDYTKPTETPSTKREVVDSSSILPPYKRLQTAYLRPLATRQTNGPLPFPILEPIPPTSSEDTVDSLRAELQKLRANVVTNDLIDTETVLKRSGARRHWEMLENRILVLKNELEAERRRRKQAESAKAELSDTVAERETALRQVKEHIGLTLDAAGCKTLTQLDQMALQDKLYKQSIDLATISDAPVPQQVPTVASENGLPTSQVDGQPGFPCALPKQALTDPTPASDIDTVTEEMAMEAFSKNMVNLFTALNCGTPNQLVQLIKDATKKGDMGPVVEVVRFTARVAFLLKAMKNKKEADEKAAKNRSEENKKNEEQRRELSIRCKEAKELAKRVENLKHFLQLEKAKTQKIAETLELANVTTVEELHQFITDSQVNNAASMRAVKSIEARVAELSTAIPQAEIQETLKLANCSTISELNTFIVDEQQKVQTLTTELTAATEKAQKTSVQLSTLITKSTKAEQENDRLEAALAAQIKRANKFQSEAQYLKTLSTERSARTEDNKAAVARINAERDMVDAIGKQTKHLLPNLNTLEQALEEELVKALTFSEEGTAVEAYKESINSFLESVQSLSIVLSSINGGVIQRTKQLKDEQDNVVAGRDDSVAGQLQKAKGEIATLQEQKRKLEFKVAEHKHRIGQLSGMHDGAKDIDARILDLKGFLEDEQKKVQRLTEENQLLAKYKQKASDMVFQMDVDQPRVKELQRENQQLLTYISEQTEKLERFQSKVERCTAEHSNPEFAQAALDTINNQLREAITRGQRLEDSLAETMEISERLSQDKSSLIENLTAEKHSLASDLEATKEKLDKITADHKQSLDRIELLQQGLKAKEKHIDNLIDENVVLAADLETLHPLAAENSRLAADLDRRNTELAAQKEEITSYITERDSLWQKLCKLQDSAEDQAGAHRFLSEQNSHLNTSIQQLESELYNYKQHSQWCTERIAALETETNNFPHRLANLEDCLKQEKELVRLLNEEKSQLYRSHASKSGACEIQANIITKMTKEAQQLEAMIEKLRKEVVQQHDYNLMFELKCKQLTAWNEKLGVMVQDLYGPADEAEGDLGKIIVEAERRKERLLSLLEKENHRLRELVARFVEEESDDEDMPELVTNSYIEEKEALEQLDGTKVAESAQEPERPVEKPAKKAEWTALPLALGSEIYSSTLPARGRPITRVDRGRDTTSVSQRRDEPEAESDSESDSESDDSGDETDEEMPELEAIDGSKLDTETAMTPSTPSIAAEAPIEEQTAMDTSESEFDSESEFGSDSGSDSELIDADEAEDMPVEEAPKAGLMGRLFGRK